jgi:hypothetical protein
MLIWKSLHKTVFFSICFFYEVNPWIAAASRCTVFAFRDIPSHTDHGEVGELVISGILAS